MKASFCMLSAAVAVCVTHAAALAQYRGGPTLWRANDPAARANPSYSPFDPQNPGGVRNPFDPPSSGEWQSPLGSYRPIPPEPRVGDSIEQNPNGNPNPGASAQIPPELLAQLVNPPTIDPKFERVKLPGVPPARHEPFAAPSWPLWAWVAAGIFVLCLLARLRRDNVARKNTAR
jgi:hypothetical protein